MATVSKKVKIKGISPLLMHSFPLVEIKNIEKMAKEEQAEIAAYRDPKGKLYVPGVAIQRTLVNAAKFSKGKGRATLQMTAAACLMITPERALLDNQSYSIDSRPVVMPATHGRVMRHRPRFDDWALEFEMTWDSSLMTEKQVRQVVDDAGQLVGLLDFRPQRMGSFGRFMVVSWSD